MFCWFVKQKYFINKLFHRYKIQNQKKILREKFIMNHITNFIFEHRPWLIPEVCGLFKNQIGHQILSGIQLDSRVNSLKSSIYIFWIWTILDDYNNSITNVIKSKEWIRGSNLQRFENRYSELWDMDNVRLGVRVSKSSIRVQIRGIVMQSMFCKQSLYSLGWVDSRYHPL